MSELFSAEDRQTALDLISQAALQDEKIVACVLVGSGVEGFPDQYCDIDLCLVAADGADIPRLFVEWKTKIESIFPVFSSTESVRGKDILLHVFLLDNYLEISLCVLQSADMKARTERWKILFDHTDHLATQMATSWETGQPKSELRPLYERRISAIWHFIGHAFVAAKRGRYWQALSDIEEIRRQTVELHGLRTGSTAKRYRDLDRMDPAFVARLSGTLVGSIGEDEVRRAIRQVVDCFFDEAQTIEAELGLSRSIALREKMNGLLEQL